MQPSLSFLIILEVKNQRAPDQLDQRPARPAPTAAREKRARLDDDLADVEDTDEGTGEMQDEVAAYIDFRFQNMDSFDLLLWWKGHSEMFPNLAQVARKIMCIPASSAASERDFSMAGFVIQERRTRLDPDTVDDILFMNSHLRVTK